MIIKEANLTSCLTHIAEALTTLNNLNDYEQGLFHSYIVEQLQEAVAALAEANEANEPDEEPNHLTPEELLGGIKSDVHEFSESIKPRVWALCDRLKYTDSSRISYIIDHVSVLDERVSEYTILGR